MPKSKPQPPLTKRRFHRLLKKAAQPVSDWTPDQEASETSGNRLSDGYNDKRKSQDKTGDKKD